MLVGKPLFLRGGFLGDSLSFNEHGLPVGHPNPSSYTLSAVQIDKVHLTRHKLELEGARYGLHFLGALPSEDPSKAVDRVRITPRKKVLKISVDREQVVKPKKEKEKAAGKEKGQGKGKEQEKAKAASTAPGGTAPAAAPTSAGSSETDAPATAPAPAEMAPEAVPGATEAPKDTMARAEDKPADESSVSTTTSPAHAARVLRDALDKVFASGLDEREMAEMPEFWQLYYKAQATGVDYRPADPNVMKPGAVDRQAKLLSSIAPDSNEYAQANAIAGRALYRAVIGPDGHPGEIAVVRPIGFGLDESAVAAIRKASFQSAMQGGKPVAETLDLAVLFRIYSKRTSGVAGEAKPGDPAKPGPYTVRAPETNP